MTLSVKFDHIPSKQFFKKSLLASNFFKNGIEGHNFTLFEFDDLRKSIKDFLISRSGNDWNTEELIMLSQANNYRKLVSINGTIIKLNPNIDILDEYFCISVNDILDNAIKSVNRYTQIAMTKNGIFYCSDNFKENTESVIIDKFIMSTERIKNLNCKAIKY